MPVGHTCLNPSSESLQEGYRPLAECISPGATVGRSGVLSPPMFLARGTVPHSLPTAPVSVLLALPFSLCQRQLALIPPNRHCGPSGGRPCMANPELPACGTQVTEYQSRSGALWQLSMAPIGSICLISPIGLITPIRVSLAYACAVSWLGHIHSPTASVLTNAKFCIFF